MAAFDDPGPAGLLAAEALQGLLQGEELLGFLVGGELIRVQIHPLLIACSLGPAAGSCVIDEQVTHGRGGDGHEVGVIVAHLPLACR